MNFAASVAWAAADLRRHGVRLAAFLADSLFSSDGVLPDPPGFLAPVTDIVHSAGGLYIADEVQAGFWRTGTHAWGYQRHGIAPDIVTMGKPMGNGLPIAGLVGRRELLDGFGRTARYFNTFGGNPVCVAAASAVLDVIADEGLAANSAESGAYLKESVASLAADSPVLGEVRGAGLYLGVDVTDPATGAPSGELAAQIVNGMRERRVLISATGPTGSVLKIRPPLPFGREHADQLAAVLGEVLRGPGLAGVTANPPAPPRRALALLAVISQSVPAGEDGGFFPRGVPVGRRRAGAERAMSVPEATAQPALIPGSHTDRHE